MGPYELTFGALGSIMLFNSALMIVSLKYKEHLKKLKISGQILAILLLILSALTYEVRRLKYDEVLLFGLIVIVLYALMLFSMTQKWNGLMHILVGLIGAVISIIYYLGVLGPLLLEDLSSDPFVQHEIGIASKKVYFLRYFLPMASLISILFSYSLMSCTLGYTILADRKDINNILKIELFGFIGFIMISSVYFFILFLRAMGVI